MAAPGSPNSDLRLIRQDPPRPQNQLIRAIRSGDETLVRRLVLEEKYNINQLVWGSTPLCYAIKSKSLSMIKLLIELKCNIGDNLLRLRLYLAENNQLDNTDLLFCLKNYDEHYPNDTVIQIKIAEVSEYQQITWQETKKILEDNTKIPAAVLEHIVKGYDNPLGRMSIFHHEQKPVATEPVAPDEPNPPASCCVIL